MENTVENSLNQKILDEVKRVLNELPKEKRIEGLGVLYDLQIIPQMEYSIQDIAYMTGFTRQGINKIYNSAAEKILRSALKKYV